MLYYIRKWWSNISLFFIRGTLSDRDIIKLMGYHIFIHPFKKENLKPSSYNLTASNCAFIKENGDQKLIIKDNKILIPAGKTGIIETQESIYVSNKIGGTYHSKVKLVNRGLGHIGTTLDPCFFGVSAIALHNSTNDDLSINIGDTIATVMFYSLRSKSTGLHDNMSGRVDDNIKLGIDKFYQFKSSKYIKIIKNKEIPKGCEIDEKFIKENLEIITDWEDGKKNNIDKIFIIDDEKLSCKKCENCSEKEKCPFKILKRINEELINRKKIVKEIKDWKNSPWITSKESLIKEVQERIKKENNKKDTFIYSVGVLIIGIVSIIIFSILLRTYKDQDLKKIFEVLMATTIPTVAIIIGMIVKYKNERGE
ncbi:deoxycytidine triphosphate deaminase [[Clostridium] sordellii]|uniref:dCTP deaminase domain-containing protein n=1 Tax=Paraclostridium sordellii TaxID=1505 RepID=UPI0005E598C0|nr:hypothetical protein [Paeniclostridium sordellii]CEN88992.1 deoxycytidine triphosphate deaminase [[Clostridium] sordellii] [Paeniclostridium sordellii]